MSVLIRIEQTESPDIDELSQRGVNRALKASFYAVGHYWKDHFLLLHFKSGNQLRYGLRPRSAQWIKRKKALAAIGIAKEGGAVPLVFRGRMRDAMKRAHVVKAYPTRATLTLIGPDYLTMNPKKANRPNLGEETLKVIPSEIRWLDGVAKTALDEAVKAERGNKRKRTK